MVDAMRAMLDELMGKERNVPLDQRSNKKLRFDDRDVCKYALAGLCPYGLFRNTKSDLGPCKYEIHEDNLQWEDISKQWEELKDKERDRYGFESELFVLLEQLVRDMDRKIERQRERAEKESGPKPLMPDDKVRLEALKKRQKDALDHSAILAEQGDVDGSMAAAAMAEDLQKQYDKLYEQLTTSDRYMTVCEVCGVFINSTDNEQRRLDHLNGKQYLGWKAIREKHKELEEKRKKKREEGEIDDAERPRSRHRERSRERSRERDRERRDAREGRDRRRDGRERERDREHASSGGRRERERDRDERYERHGRDDRPRPSRY